MAKIFVNNLDREFRNIKKEQKQLNVETGGMEVMKKATGRNIQAQILPSVSGSSQVVEPFFSPWLQRTTIELPTNYKELMKWRRYFYHNEPIVTSACELHAQFPLSTFYVTHEDEVIKQDFEKLVEDLELFDFLLEMLLEYNVAGEANPYGFFDNDEDPHVWTKFILLEPSQLEVKWAPLVGGKRDEVVFLEFSKEIKEIINNGPNHKVTGKLYNLLPPDVITRCKNGEKLPLNSIQVSRIKRTGNYFQIRGTSIIDRCFKWLMLRDKLRSAQYAIADRHVTPAEFYLLGEPGQPATQEEIDNFRDILLSQWSSPNKAIVYHHAVRIQWEGASGRILPLQPEFEYIDKQLCIALLINEGIVTAERQPYASTSVALDVMIQRYLTIRKRIEKWVEHQVFAPICKLNKIYKRTSAELEHRIKFQKSDEDLWLPHVKWDKEDLRNDMNKINLLIGLVDKGWIPKSMVLPLLNIDPNQAMKELKKEKQNEKGILPSTPGMPSPVVPSGTMPESPPLPEESMPMEEGTLPESPTGEAVPPESHELERGEGELPTGI